MGAPLNLIEELGHYLLVMPLNAALRQLDRLSYKLEGTLLREVLSHPLSSDTHCFYVAGFQSD